MKARFVPSFNMKTLEPDAERVRRGVGVQSRGGVPWGQRRARPAEDQAAPIYKLVDKWKVAIPLHPEYGTDPNVFYVPPILPPRLDENGEVDESKPRIPNEYLISLFGPKVLDVLEVLDGEIRKARKGEKSELMDILIAYKWSEMFGGFDRDPGTIEWTKDKHQL